MATTINDNSWVKSSFLLPAEAILGDGGSVRRIYSTSMQKASDTTLGGNFILNPLPQFTRYTDLKHNTASAYNNGKGTSIDASRLPKSHTTSDKSSNGMGRVYSEKLDDNMQHVTFRCGVAEFNDLFSYYTNYYSVPAATMARTGRTAGFFYNLGWVLGSVASMPLQAFVFAGRALKFALNKPASKYYYMRPTMYPYWHAVSSMVNGIAANMGIMPRPIANRTAMLYDQSEKINSADITAYHNMMPSIYRESGGIDVFAVAQRGQRLVNARRDLLAKDLEDVSNRGSYDEVQNVMRRRLFGDDLRDGRLNYTNPSLEAYADLWRSSEGMGVTDGSDLNDSYETVKRGPGWWDKIKDATMSEARQGSEFVSFRVDYTGTQTESFSNSTKEPSISQTLNETSAKARETRFSAADGNIDSLGVAKTITSAFTGFINGGLSALKIDGLAQLAGSAFADIPKVYDSSSCDFNKTTFTIPLRSPYGDPVSRLQNLILPLCSLFAMAVPLSTGKQSYTSPFLVECFNQGRTHIRLGMIESLSVTRGVGDVGWSNQGHFLGCDVQITVVDLSSVMHMPLQAGFELTDKVIMGTGYLGAAGVAAVTGNDANAAGEQGAAIAAATIGSTYDDDNAYTDYLSILSGMPLEAEINTLRKWAVRLARQRAKFDDWRSPNRLAMSAMSGWTGDLIKAVSLSTDRQ